MARPRPATRAWPRERRAASSALAGVVAGVVPTPVWVFLVIGAGIFVLFSILARFSPAVVRRVLGGQRAAEQVAKMAGRVVAATLIVLGLFIGLSVVFKSQEVALVPIVLGVVVASVGLQDLLKNYVSGFYVQLERNIRVGDVVTLAGQTGTVTEIRLRVTYLRAADGALVVVPNSELFNDIVQVRSAAGGAPELGSEPPRESK